MKIKHHAALLCIAACLSLHVFANPPSTAKGNFAIAEVDATPSQISATGKVVALVIGINTFKDKTFGSLAFAEKDAKDVAAFLEESGVKKDKIKLLVGQDATFTEVMDALTWLRETAASEPGSSIFFFFSSHGERVAEGHALVLYDSKSKTLHKTGLVWEKAEKDLRTSSDKQVIVIDACYAQAAGGSIGRKKSNFLSSEYLKLFKAQGRVSFFSSEEQQTSEEHPQTKNGVFTYFFLRGLRGEADKNADRCITASELATYVREQVRRFTRDRQSPKLEDKTREGTPTDFLLYALPQCGTIKQKGYLRLAVSHPRTKARIKNKKRGTTEEQEIKWQELNLSLLPGPYQIRISKSGYKDVERDVEIAAGKKEELLVPLAAVENSDIFGLIGSLQPVSVGASSSALSSQPPRSPSSVWPPLPDLLAAEPPLPRPTSIQPPPQQPSVKPELPSGWKSLKEAYEACHPSAECSAEDGQKAARLFREAREGLRPPVPAWVLMAWEGASLAKAKALAEPIQRYKDADQAYEAWKKQNGYRGATLRFYTQLQSHRVFGKFLWFAAMKTSNATEKQRLLGLLWQEWRFSPLARDAYYHWMQALGQYGYSLLTEKEIASAGRALLLPTYRQASVSLRFFRYLKDRRGWKQAASEGLIDAHRSLRAWSSVKSEAQALLSDLPLPRRKGRYYRRVLSKRMWLITVVAEALLYTEGLEAAKSFLDAHPSLPTRDRYRYLGSVLAWQREKGQLAEASQTLQALLDLQHASPPQARRLRHTLAAQHLAQGDAARAGSLWSPLAQDFSLSVEEKLSLYFWAGVAAEKASSLGERYFRELCTSYPLSWYGFLSCARLKRTPALAPVALDPDPFLSNPAAVALRSELKERELFAFFAWNELHQGSAPSAGLVIASARAFAEAGDWETAFQVLLQHQLEPLFQGRLPLDVLRLAFPRPADAQAPLQIAARETSLDTEALLAIVRRESGFSYPTFGLRVGLMGLDPLWSSETPKDHPSNLRLGAKRLSELQQKLSSLPLAFAAYRGAEDVLQAALSSNSFAKDQPLLWLEFFDSTLQEYTLHPSNGTLWYYLFYRWLSSPSSVPSFSWLP